MRIYYLLIIACIFYQPIFARTFFVSGENGLNSRSVLEAQLITSPWKTIQKAADMCEPGDTVLIRSGVYVEEVRIRKSGLENRYIVFMPYANESVTIDGNNKQIALWRGLVDIQFAQYIEIHNLKVSNSSAAGIFVGDAKFIKLKGNKTYNTFSSGIGVWNCDSVQVLANDIELACNGGNQECLTISGTSNFLVGYNKVHDNAPGTYGKEGIDCKDGCSNGEVFGNQVYNLYDDCKCRGAIYLDSWNSFNRNIKIYNNKVYNCSGGIHLGGELGGTTENLTIFNNIISSCAWDGITVNGYHASGYSAGPIKNVSIINNTIYNNRINAIWDGGGIVISNPKLVNLVIRNNIISKNKTASIIIYNFNGTVPLSELHIDHNLIDEPTGDRDEYVGKDTISGDAKFVNPQAGNFELNTGSPAIDKAIPLLPNFNRDYNNNRRPSGRGWDLGALEHVDPNGKNELLLLFPVPAKEVLFVELAVGNLSGTEFLITSISGQNISAGKFNKNRESINISKFSAGSYILSINYQGTVHHRVFEVLR